MHGKAQELIGSLLLRHVNLSENGVAVLDADNRFLFYNDAYAGMFGFAGQSMLGKTHDDFLVFQYQNKTGINIENKTLDQWLAHVHARHRSAPFRNFEVDLLDGRWILLSEQLFPSGEMIMFCSEITRQKTIEADLREAQVKLDRLAHTDELTGVWNRRFFLQQLSAEVGRAQRYQHPLCLVTLDLDHFKKVNDGWGHPAGDEVLRHFTQFLRDHLREVDLLGRIGGEEFAILMPETGLPEAQAVIDRMISQLGEQVLDSFSPGFRYTFSAGLAALSSDPPIDCNALLANSDQALYRAKNAGRNRAVAFDGALR